MHWIRFNWESGCFLFVLHSLIYTKFYGLCLSRFAVDSALVMSVHKECQNFDAIKLSRDGSFSHILSMIIRCKVSKLQNVELRNQFQPY